MPKVRVSFLKSARVILKKEHKPTKRGEFYPAEDVPHPRARHFKPTTTKLRSRITPGTVLILLSGRFRGRRVVFLKQLPSGLLLVSGPYLVNGVPLRRVNQSMVIATSTKLDVSGVDASSVTDEMFKATKKTPIKTADEFFAARKTAVAFPAERKALQDRIDAGIKFSPEQRLYLKARFALSNGQRPHEMRF